MNNIFVHLGHSEFDVNKFIPISNSEHFVKPKGGLWGSPIDSNCNWEDWINTNDFFLDKYGNGKFYFKLKSNTRVLTIDNANMLDTLPQLDDELFGGKNKTFVELDFEQLSKTYDAIIVLISSDGQLYWDLYGWDVDSILVMNPNCIDIVDESEIG